MTTAELSPKRFIQRNAKPNRKCDNCSTRFTFERSTARFCSDGCRLKAHRKQDEAAAFRGHLRTSGGHEWYTPPEILEAARAVMGGIDLDPASSRQANLTVNATDYYDEEGDGLAQPWAGRVWLNPPYGKLAPLFARKFLEHHPHDVPQAILLLANHHLSTAWFHRLTDLHPILCFPPRRLRFSASASPPAHGSVILGFGVEPALFREAFGGFGWVR